MSLLNNFINMNKNAKADETNQHSRSIKNILKRFDLLDLSTPSELTKLQNKRLIEDMADIENMSTDKEVEPSVRSFLRRLYEDNIDDIFTKKSKGGKIKTKYTTAKKNRIVSRKYGGKVGKPRGWGAARHGNK